MASLLSAAVSSTTAAAHSAAVALSSGSPIHVGSALPSVPVGVDSPDATVDLGTLKGKNVIVTVPAAFSPSCSDQVPEYIKRFDEFKAKGVDGVYVVSVNDIFVMNAWKSKLASSSDATDTPVRFLADKDASWAASVGLLFDASGLLGGPRLKRAAIVAQDNVVEQIFVENSPPEVTVSSAANVLAKL